MMIECGPSSGRRVDVPIDKTVSQVFSFISPLPLGHSPLQLAGARAPVGPGVAPPLHIWAYITTSSQNTAKLGFFNAKEPYICGKVG